MLFNAFHALTLLDKPHSVNVMQWEQVLEVLYDDRALQGYTLINGMAPCISLVLQCPLKGNTCIHF